MKHYLSFIVLLLFNFGYAQTPVLVKDINPGPGRVSSSGYDHLQINDVIYFVGDIQGRRDLYAIKNGEVNHISTMCESDCGLLKILLFEFQDKLYFLKKIDKYKNQLWESNGTVDGTKMVFEYTGRFNSYAVGNNSKFYLGLANLEVTSNPILEIFISDGTSSGTKIIKSDVRMGGANEDGGKPIKYGNGIVFANTTIDSLQLYSFDDEDLILLNSVRVKKGSVIRGLKSINTQDLIILVQNNDELSSDLYKYDFEKNILSKEMSLPFTHNEYPFIRDFGTDTLVLFYHLGGHFLITGNPLTFTNITPFSSELQSIEELYYTYNYNSAYGTVESISEYSWEEKIVLFDKDLSNTKIFTLETTPIGMIGYEDYAFISTGSFGPSGRITMYDLINKEEKVLFAVSPQSVSTQGIQLLGVIDGKLYFIGRLDEQIGKELYYIETGLPSSIKDVKPSFNNLYDIQVKGNTFTVISEKNQSLNVEYYDTIGRLLKSQTIVTNMDYMLDDRLKGMIFLKVSDPKTLVAKTTSVFIP